MRGFEEFEESEREAICKIIQVRVLVSRGVVSGAPRQSEGYFV